MLTTYCMIIFCFCFIDIVRLTITQVYNYFLINKLNCVCIFFPPLPTYTFVLLPFCGYYTAEEEKNKTKQNTVALVVWFSSKAYCVGNCFSKRGCPHSSCLLWRHFIPKRTRIYTLPQSDFSDWYFGFMKKGIARKTQLFIWALTPASTLSMGCRASGQPGQRRFNATNPHVFKI